MKIKIETKKSKLPSENIVMGLVADVAWELEKEVPVKCTLKFKIPGFDELVEKSYPASMDEKSLLRKDAQVISGRRFESDDDASDYDLDSLKGSKIPVVLMHKPAAV